MKVNDIRSFFGSKSGSPSVPPSPVEVPTRRSKKAPKKKEEEEDEVVVQMEEDDEDPFPADCRGAKAKKADKQRSKRKAKKLSDSEDDDDFKPVGKKMEVDKPKPPPPLVKKVEKKKEEEKKPVRKEVDPNDFFSGAKVKQSEKKTKRERTPAKEEKTEESSPLRRSPRKKQKLEEPEDNSKQRTSDHRASSSSSVSSKEKKKVRRVLDSDSEEEEEENFKPVGKKVQIASANKSPEKKKEEEVDPKFLDSKVKKDKRGTTTTTPKKTDERSKHSSSKKEKLEDSPSPDKTKKRRRTPERREKEEKVVTKKMEERRSSSRSPQKKSQSQSTKDEEVTSKSRPEKGHDRSRTSDKQHKQSPSRSKNRTDEEKRSHGHHHRSHASLSSTSKTPDKPSTSSSSKNRQAESLDKPKHSSSSTIKDHSSKSQSQSYKRRVQDDDEEEEERTKPRTSSSSSKSKKAEASSPPPEQKADPQKRASNYAKFLAHQTAKPRHFGEKLIPLGAPGCLSNLTFVMTGVQDSLERDEAKALIEKYGGRVTSALSGKTNYLLVGEDAGESKVKKAEGLKGCKLINEDALFEMIRASDPGANANRRVEDEEVELMELDVLEEIEMPKKEPSSPIKKKKESKSSPSSSKVEEDSQPLIPPQSHSMMWVDKYRPQSIKRMVGQAKDGSNAHKLVNWLRRWFEYHGSSGEKVKSGNPFAKDPEGKTFKCALLSGPPGIGKTTSAHLAIKEVGYDYFEMNASDTRNKKGLHNQVFDALSNKTMFHNGLTSQHVLIMDEVDGMSGNEDRGGVQELIGLIKGSRVPIICICNDRNHPKIRSLANYCYDLRFNRPSLQELKGFIASVCFKEKVKLDSEQVTQLCISTDQDVRQILHQIELYKDSTSKQGAFGPKKDLRFGPWDVCRKIFYKPEHAHMSIHDKTGLFFQDYSLGPLFVQENYVKWNPAKAKQNKIRRMDLLARTAGSIADGDLADSLIRRTNNWSLLPLAALWSSYIPGELMESDVSGPVEFPQWLGKNSNKNKRARLLQSLHTHVHLEVSGSLEALNMDYLPYLRRKITGNLVQGDVDRAARVMETYSLLRDDMESINELSLWPGMKNPMEKLDSKTKASFTRTVNKEMLPYSNEKIAKKRGKAAAADDDFIAEDDEIEEESDEEDDKPEKDLMIKMKTKKKGATAGPSTNGDKTKKAPAKKSKK